jgi:hypothetical protein
VSTQASSQRAYPSSQTNPQTPPSQIGEAKAGASQTLSQLPQWPTLTPTSTQLSAQTSKPASQVNEQVPCSQAATLPEELEQATSQVPQ